MMMFGNNVSYVKAYTEVNCLLEHMPQSYIDKLPKKLIELIQKQSNEQYNINIDTNKSLIEQNFSKKTKDLIAILKYNYWSTDEEKQQLKQIFYANENKYQEELREKYNPDNIFKNNKKEEIIIENVNLPIEIKKESILIRFINFIKNLISRKDN